MRPCRETFYAMLESILDRYSDEEFLTADGFDDAVIGVTNDFSAPRLIYSVFKCYQILRQSMTKEEAYEYFEFNIVGADFGDKTPIWCWDGD